MAIRSRIECVFDVFLFLRTPFATEASSFNQLQDATTLGEVEGRYHGKLVATRVMLGSRW